MVPLFRATDLCLCVRSLLCIIRPKSWHTMLGRETDNVALEMRVSATCTWLSIADMFLLSRPRVELGVTNYVEV